PFFFGTAFTSTQANFDGNFPYGGAPEGPYLERTCPAGNYAPNAFGLFDLHGNVWDWCNDWFADDYYAKGPSSDPPGPGAGTKRVLRGGAWFNNSRGCRSAMRISYDEQDTSSHWGMRVAMDTPAE